MKYKLTHTQKALIGALFVEGIFFLFLFRVHLNPGLENRKAQIILNFDENILEEEQAQEKIPEIPDITPYLKTHEYLSTLASNMGEEESSDEKQIPGESTEELPEKPERIVPEPLPDPITDTGGEETGDKIIKEMHEVKSYTGASRITYNVPGRYLVKSANPLYLCPDYMKGLVTLSVEVTPGGRVVKAIYLPSRSTTDLECLINASIRYARKMKFNKSEISINQKGVIKFLY